MLGAITGDIAGSVYEWNNIRTKDFQPFAKNPKTGQAVFFTDDSVMTCAVASALLLSKQTGNGIEESSFKVRLISEMHRLGERFPGRGYGGRFAAWLFDHDTQPYNSYGNGSAMRVSPCFRAADSLEEALMLAKWSAEVTHNHPEGIKGAQATVHAMWMARDGASANDIRAEIADRYGYNMQRTCDDIRPSYRFNESCQGTVPEAIIAYLDSTDFDDAIRNAISLGGDTDTLAAITGGIAEAAYGMPMWWTLETYEHLDSQHLQNIVRSFYMEFCAK